MKKIPFLNDYYITKDGQVYSSKKGGMKKIKSRIDTSRYKRIGLRISPKKQKLFLVHRLVAITYLENPNKLPYVNHKDGNKLNNNVDNLEWCTSSDNIKHAFSIGLNSSVGMNNSNNVLSEEQVLQIYDKLLQNYRVCDLAKEYGVTTSAIGKIKTKNNWEYLLKDLPDIPLKSKSSKLSIKTVNWICEMLESGMKQTSIVKNSLTPITIDQVCDIKRKRCYKNIVSSYNF